MIESATEKLTLCYDYHKTEEKNRGRNEIRTVHVFDATKEIKELVPHIKAVVRVKRIRQRSIRNSEEIFYYVSDVKYSAKRFNEGIRKHWSIENKLHWVKDVVMKEDKSTIKQYTVASIVSILKSLVINIAYLNSNSVINFQRTIAHNIEQMYVLLE